MQTISLFYRTHIAFLVHSSYPSLTLALNHLFFFFPVGIKSNVVSILKEIAVKNINHISNNNEDSDPRKTYRTVRSDGIVHNNDNNANHNDINRNNEKGNNSINKSDHTSSSSNKHDPYAFPSPYTSPNKNDSSYNTHSYNDDGYSSDNGNNNNNGNLNIRNSNQKSSSNIKKPLSKVRPQSANARSNPTRKSINLDGLTSIYANPINRSEKDKIQLMSKLGFCVNLKRDFVVKENKKITDENKFPGNENILIGNNVYLDMNNKIESTGYKKSTQAEVNDWREFFLNDDMLRRETPQNIQKNKSSRKNKSVNTYGNDYDQYCYESFNNSNKSSHAPDSKDNNHSHHPDIRRVNAIIKKIRTKNFLEDPGSYWTDEKVFELASNKTKF
jgi:hypothetical protein